MTYTIDSIDKETGNVTFTIVCDDGFSHTDTRCDLHYWDETITTELVPEEVTETLVENAKDEVGKPIKPYIHKEVVPEHTINIRPYMKRHYVDPAEALERYAKHFNEQHMAETPEPPVADAYANMQVSE